MPPRISQQSPSGPASINKGGRSAKAGVGKDSSIFDRIQPIGFEGEGIKVLLYGISGTGKTTLWATFPKPILAILCSGGAKPGELRSINTEEYRRSVKQVSLETSDEFLQLVEDDRISAYKTIVLDHATGFQDLVLKEILGLDKPITVKEWGMADMADYGQCSVRVKRMLATMFSLACNVVVVAHEKYEEPKKIIGDEVKPSIGAALQGSIAGWLHGAADYVGRTCKLPRYKRTKMEVAGTVETVDERVKDEYDYCLFTGMHDIVATKFRVPKGQVLPKYIKDPDYNKIMAVINGTYLKKGST